MSDIKWQEPPNYNGARYRAKYDVIADQLRQRPNEWAVLREGISTTSSVTYVKRRLGPGFEAISRRSTSGEGFDIYARFVGEATR